MQDLTGKTIGGYQIVEQIGKGGMATVFRAYQPSLDRDVAIKVLPPYYAEQDETFLQRFKREARAIAKLRHPNILMVMDFGQEDDLSYIVMEYVTAGTLKDRLNEPIQLDEIFELTKQVASALQYAHDQGVVHRDVKPSNIMMPKSDWALLTDFGLARMVGGSFLTQSGMTVGTPAYMSPEQGSGERVDHRTDIYSLGVMLYEMVVGEVPYTAETPMAVVVKHIVDPLPMPRAKNPDIPEELQKVILKCLAKNPDDRYQSIQEIPEALEKIVETHPGWSAAEMKAVNALREPHVDRADTRVFEDEALEDGQTEAPTVAPQPDEQAAQSAEEMRAEEQADEQVDMPAETVADVPEVKPVPASASAPERTRRIGTEPPKKKRRIWPLLVGGLLLLGICAVGGLFAFNVLFSNSGNNDVASSNPPPPATQQQPPPGEMPPDVGDMGPEVAPEENADGPPEQTVQNVVELLEQGELERARQLLRLAFRRNPQFWDVLVFRVEQLESMGDFEAAAILLSIGVDVNPDAPIEDYSWLGWLYYSANMYMEAYNTFEKTLLRQPDFVEAHDGFVNSAILADNLPDAIRFIENLKDRHPDEAEIYRTLGDLYDYNGDLERAFSAYERGMELAPQDPWLPVHAAPIYFYAGDEGRARELLTLALELAPDDPAILDRIAWAYLDMEDFELAYQVFERALELNKRDGWSSLGFAKSIYYLGREQERVPPLLDAAERIARESNDAWLFADIGWFYLDIGDCGNAERLFNEVEEFAPGVTDAQDGLNECN